MNLLFFITFHLKKVIWIAKKRYLNYLLCFKKNENFDGSTKSHNIMCGILAFSVWGIVLILLYDNLIKIHNMIYNCIFFFL